MLEEDLYIPGQVMETAGNDSPSSSTSSYSLEELSQPYTPSLPGPSTSLQDVSTEHSCRSSQVIRRSTSERTKKLSLASRTSSNGRPPPLPTRSTPPSPQNVRPFPLLKPPKPKNRPGATHFNFQNLLPKRPGRDNRAGTDGEPRKTKKEPPAPVPLSIGLYPLSVSGSSAMSYQEPVSPGGVLPFPKPDSSATGSSPDSMLGSNGNVNTVLMPTQTPPKFGEGSPHLTLPLVEDMNGKLEVDFPYGWQNEDPKRVRTRSFSYPTSEDDGQRKPAANRELGPSDLNTVGTHGHAQQASDVQNSRNSGLLTDVEPIESNRRDRKLIVIQPAPPPKDIPGRSRPQPIPSSWSFNGTPNPTTGLSRSVPDSLTGHNRDQLLSPTIGPSKPIKSLSTSSLAITTSHFTRRVPSLRRKGAKGVVKSPTAEIPPNPRQHRLLEIIYAEMHAARFVNLAPLSLLDNHIQTYFKSAYWFPCFPGLITYSFPSRSRRPYPCTAYLRLPTSPRLRTPSRV
jgi:hypothetical protein